MDKLVNIGRLWGSSFGFLAGLGGYFTGADVIWRVALQANYTNDD